jgi:hypothetical protein
MPPPQPEVVGEFLVELVGKGGEKLEFTGPGDRADSQFVLRGQGALLR